MSRELTVLSIDFDFFQVVDKHTILNYYPDGVDLPTELTEFIWGSHYNSPRAEEREKLLRVNIDRQLLIDLINIVVNNSYSGTKLMAANSHKHIYNFISDELSSNNYDSVRIYNVDMHPDYKNSNTKLDCGNWLGKAVKDFKNCKATWIHNPISLELMAEENYKGLERRKTFKCLEKVSPDLVYICRSDTWTPPHLDNHFNDLLYTLAEYIPRNKVEHSVMSIRQCKI